MTTDRLPQVAPCACCGAYSLTPADETAALLRVCDVLVLTALRQVGNRIVRTARARFRELDEAGLRRDQAHTLWPATDETAAKGLVGAWDVIPALMSQYGQTVLGADAGQVADVLDEYVHDLVITGTEHDAGELAYRLGSRLGMVLPVREGGDGGAAGE